LHELLYLIIGTIQDIVLSQGYWIRYDCAVEKLHPMKLLLVPGNNSLSHVAKCAALEDALSRRGHLVLIAVTRRYSDFLRRLSLAHTIVPDIQESDGGGLPSLAWFRSLDLIEHCIRAEIDLLRAFRPDRVIGIFRFTLKVSADVLGIPYDAVACGCMMPDVDEVLGFGPDEKKTSDQALYLDNFFRFAARRMGVVMDRYGIEPIQDIRSLLVGERTFLWDYPQFMPLPELEGRFHVGPLNWVRWPDACCPSVPYLKKHYPLALVSLGTRPASRTVVEKAVRCLLACNYHVIVACGGHGNLMGISPEDPRVRCWRFAPLWQVLRHTDLLVCHGGQMTIFEALLRSVPVLVIPSQPEQAHNGLCVERIGCGLRLAPSIAFKGDTKTYVDAFIGQPDAAVVTKIAQIDSNSGLTMGLAQAQEHLRGYDAPNMIADMMEMAWI